MHAARGSAACLAACRNDLGRQYCVKMNACSVLPAAHRFPILSSAWVDEVHARRTKKRADERADHDDARHCPLKRRGQKSTPRLVTGAGEAIHICNCGLNQTRTAQNNQNFHVPLPFTTSQYHSKINQKVVNTTFFPVNEEHCVGRGGLACHKVCLDHSHLTSHKS